MTKGVYERTPAILEGLAAKRRTPEYRAKISAGVKHFYVTHGREGYGNWKGGRWVRKDGYTRVNLGDGTTCTCGRQEDEK